MLYCYQTNPIDLWYGALTAEEMISTCTQGWNSASAIAKFASDLARIEQFAKDAFRKLRWEGDASEGPFFFALPADGWMRIGYMLKQSNNGTTFIASPEALPWIEESDSTETLVLDFEI